MNVVNPITPTEQIQAIVAPQPHYTNDFAVCILLGCTFILAAVLSDRQGFLGQLLKNFFQPRENIHERVRTTGVVYRRTGLLTVTFASLGLLMAIYAEEKLATTTSLAHLWLLATAAIAVLQMLKFLLFIITDRIFFDKPIATAWENSYINWGILSSIPVYLLAVGTLFFDLSSHTVSLLSMICAILLEMCLLYKAFHIFLPKKYGILQLFVYLCTLELIPLLMAGKALVLFV